MQGERKTYLKLLTEFRTDKDTFLLSALRQIGKGSDQVGKLAFSEVDDLVKQLFTTAEATKEQLQGSEIDEILAKFCDHEDSGYQKYVEERTKAVERLVGYVSTLRRALPLATGGESPPLDENQVRELVLAGYRSGLRNMWLLKSGSPKPAAANDGAAAIPAAGSDDVTKILEAAGKPAEKPKATPPVAGHGVTPPLAVESEPPKEKEESLGRWMRIKKWFKKLGAKLLTKWGKLFRGAVEKAPVHSNVTAKVKRVWGWEKEELCLIVKKGAICVM